MIKTTTFFIIILFIPFLLFSQGQEQTVVSLSYGENQLAAISEYGEIDEYSFHGNAGDVIMLRMRDETKVDAYLRIYDPDGDMIAFKWSDGGQAKIQDLKLEISGTYSVLAYDRNHNDVGNYGISLHQLNTNSYSVPLPSMSSFTDQITQIVAVNSYQIEVEKGDVLFAQMRAKTVHLECEFFVYNSIGELVSKSNNTGRLATVGPLVVDESDTYQILVTDRGGNDSDEFGFTTMLLNKHESAPELTCGDNLHDNLEQLVERKAYRLVAKPGQIPLIEARSNNKKLETSVEVYNQDGERILHSFYTNKLISHLISPSSKEQSYLIVVYDKNGNDYGDFGVQVQFLDNSFCSEALGCDNQNELISVNGLAQNRLFSIEGESGKKINISLKETEAFLEPYLRVFDLEGNLIAEAKHAVKADLSDSKYPNDGTYLVLASDVSGNDIGDFELNAPVGSLGLAITDCQTVYAGFDPLSNATISVLAEGSNLQYLWSNGNTTETIQVSPLEPTEFSVTVTNSEGCSSVASSFVDVVDVNCGNGNNVKVQICHVNESNGEHKDKCVDEDGVWGHLDNGDGHTQCYIGTCNYVTICEGGNGQGEGLATDEKVTNRNSEIGDMSALIFPNPTADIFNIKIDKSWGEAVTISILNTTGKIIDAKEVVGGEKALAISMQNYNIPGGIYFIKIEGEKLTKSELIFYLK